MTWRRWRRGRIDGISYGSKEPLAKRLASFGVDIADNPAAGELLARLRGTAVRLTLAAGEVTATVMNGETGPTVFQGSNGTDTAVHNLPWINLLTAEGVRSYNLTECRWFEIRDEALSAELSKALAALAEYRADRTKTVDVSLSGEGSGEIVVAYVQESPVWKTSYRLVLPEESKDSPISVNAGDHRVAHRAIQVRRGDIKVGRSENLTRRHGDYIRTFGRDNVNFCALAYIPGGKSDRDRAESVVFECFRSFRIRGTTGRLNEWMTGVSASDARAMALEALRDSGIEHTRGTGRG